MKNRRHNSIKNWKLFCWHIWYPIEEVSSNWDIAVGVSILCKCSKCGKIKCRPNFTINEIPDELINPNIEYR